MKKQLAGKKHAKVTFRDIRSGKSVTLRDTVEIAPGVYAGGIPPECLPQTGLCGFLRRADGTYVPVARTTGLTMKLTQDIGPRLGISAEGDHSLYKTIKRLMFAGFIKGVPVTRSSWNIDVESFWRLWNQLKTEGKRFWTAEREAKMREARYHNASEDEEGEDS